MIEERVKSWDELRALIDSWILGRKLAASVGTHHSAPLYRGQQDARWPLETTLERWSAKPLTVLGYHERLTSIQHEVESHLERSWNIPGWPEFNRLLESNPSYPNLINQGDLYEFMAFARHHGFPSPLLDWSASPYVAAYFAFANARPQDEVAIFAFQEYCGHGKAGYAAAPRIVELGPNVRTHRRHFLQQAQYTVAISDDGVDMSYCSHENGLSASAGERQDILLKITAPGEQRSAALEYLYRHNITSYSLFGSADRLMESLAIRAFVLSE